MIVNEEYAGSNFKSNGISFSTCSRAFLKDRMNLKVDWM